MKARTLLTFLLIFSTTGLHAASDQDPVADCRQQHADNTGAHIACLEAALNRLLASPAPAPADQGSEAATVLGSEQVIQKKRATGEITEQPLSVQIVAVQYNSAGQGIFRLDNGQVWRETEVTPRHLRLDAGNPHQATLERGTIGGYRMQVEGVRRMLKVERLK